MKYGINDASSSIGNKSRISTVPQGSGTYFSKLSPPHTPAATRHHHVPVGLQQHRHPSHHQRDVYAQPGQHQHHHQHMIQRSLPGSPVRATTPLFRSSRIRSHDESFHQPATYPSLRTSLHQHTSGNYHHPPSSLMHHNNISTAAGNNIPEGTGCCPAADCASANAGSNPLTSTAVTASGITTGRTLSNPDLRAPYRYSFIPHQPPYATGHASSHLSASAVNTDCSACCQLQQQQQQHSLCVPLCGCCMSPLGTSGTAAAAASIRGSSFNRHQLLHRNSDPALTMTGESKFPSVSEITRPPFLDPSFNLVEKYEYNFDNYFKSKRDRLQPFYRSSAPGSRSGTPTTNVSLVNPFETGRLTPQLTGCGSALSNTTLTSGIMNHNNSGRMSRNRPMSQATSGNCDHTIPDLKGQEMSTKSKFMNQLKYFVEERKGELGFTRTLEPQTGSVTDVNTLMNLYSDPPDPVKSKFPPPGVPAYQSVPQSYFDPNSTTFNSLRDPVPNAMGCSSNYPRRRHSFGGERDCYMNSSGMAGHRLTSASPFPSFYASYAPPTASSLLNIHHGLSTASHGNPSSMGLGYSSQQQQQYPSGLRPSSPFPRDQCATMYSDDRIDQQLHSLMNEAVASSEGGLMMHHHHHAYPHPSSSAFDLHHRQQQHHPVMHDQQINQSMPLHHHVSPYHQMHHSHQQHLHQQPPPSSYTYASAATDPRHHGMHHHGHQLQHQHSFPVSSSYLSTGQHHHNLSPSLMTTMTPAAIHQQHPHSHHLAPASSSMFHHQHHSTPSTHRSFQTDYW